MEWLAEVEQIFDAFDVGIDLFGVIGSHDPSDRLVLFQTGDGPSKDALHSCHLCKKKLS
jgi:hypothetical protein